MDRLVFLGIDVTDVMFELHLLGAMLFYGNHNDKHAENDVVQLCCTAVPLFACIYSK